MMIEPQRSTGSASPTGLALHHSGEEMSINIDPIDPIEPINPLYTEAYQAFLDLLQQYDHPDDQNALIQAWTQATSAARRGRVASDGACRDCGAPGSLDAAGYGISCGCAAK